MASNYVPRSPGFHAGFASPLLRDARRRAGLTQEELAGRAGVHRPLISLYESGKKDPTVNMLARLIDACDMELRMRADQLTDADRVQYERDARTNTRGSAQSDVARLRRQIQGSPRRLTPDEIERLSPRASA